MNGSSSTRSRCHPCCCIDFVFSCLLLFVLWVRIQFLLEGGRSTAVLTMTLLYTLHFRINQVGDNDGCCRQIVLKIPCRLHDETVVLTKHAPPNLSHAPVVVAGAHHRDGPGAVLQALPQVPHQEVPEEAAAARLPPRNCQQQEHVRAALLLHHQQRAGGGRRVDFY